LFGGYVRYRMAGQGREAAAVRLDNLHAAYGDRSVADRPVTIVLAQAEKAC
jgi:hypothetical protein